MALENKLAKVETRYLEDRISRLPDDLLHHILSFLSAKEAFATSILSTRWSGLFNFIPTLNFINCWVRLESWRLDYNEEEAKFQVLRFMNSVDRVLLHRKVSNIHKFCIDWNEHFDQSRVNAWISAVVSHDVKNLILRNVSYIDSSKPLKHVLPCCLFSCESLTELKISGSGNTVFDLPSFISLPNLKVLRLSRITFGDDSSFEQLISNCPILEELTINSCCWINMEKVCVSAPALKSLIFNAYRYTPHGYIHSIKVIIAAPNLVSFRYSGALAKDYIISCLPSLVDAELDIWRRGFVSTKSIQRKAITKLLGAISNVKFLTMHGNTFKAISHAGVISLNSLTLYKLHSLEVTSISRVTRSAIKSLWNFINVSPNLESLVFSKGFLLYGRKIDCANWICDMVPECLMLHLKAVEFREFRGDVDEHYLVEWFLKNSRVLERMTIISSKILRECLQKGCNKGKRYLRNRNLMERLRALPRASTDCVIVFS